MVRLQFEDLKKLGVVLKRAQFFITCGGRMRQGLQFTAQTLQRQLEAMERGQAAAGRVPAAVAV